LLGLTQIALETRFLTWIKRLKLRFFVEKPGFCVSTNCSCTPHSRSTPPNKKDYDFFDSMSTMTFQFHRIIVIMIITKS